MSRRFQFTDLLGGLMAAIVALPLCLAFGVASGLGAAAGLYGAIALGIIAALFGGTPGQCSGPTGPMTVVAAALLSANTERPELVFAAVIAAGFFQIILSRVKAGELISYVPYPVISGFMSGIGIIIIAIEMGPLFGLPATGNVLEAVKSWLTIHQQFNSNAVIISTTALGIIYLLPKISKRLPSTLIAIIVTTWLAYIFKMDLPRIGEIPAALPVAKLPNISVTDLHTVIQNGLTLAVLGAIDSLLTSLVMDKITGNRHDSNKELFGQGLGNIAAGIFCGLPGAGATMRSMVNIKSGGRTRISGALHGLILLVILLSFGPITALIPLASLAAILLSVGLSILDWRVLKSITKTPKSDVIVMSTVLLLTIFVDLIIAVLVGVALASVLFVKKLADARTSSIANLNSLDELCHLTEHVPEPIRKSAYSYVLNGPIFFGEAKNIADAVDKLFGAKYVILRFANVPFMDQTGAFSLETAIEKWEQNNIIALFVGMPPHIKKILEDTGARIDLTNSFEQFEHAINAIDVWESQQT
ncbi:MAG: SulP family inorganic anion transporter [Cyanobacteria bacterium TGS_CYA1]|nr:SulP family inorganic anion transporter [Cyanobacteria bacterium TGS_CYA1]